METPISPEQKQKPNFFRRILKRIVPPSTKAPKRPASINRPPTSEDISPVTTDRSIRISDSGDDPVRLRFVDIMSKVSPEMDKAWRSWAGSDEDRRTYPALWRELQEFGLLATKDTLYQHEIHQLIRDRFGSNPITVYHPISMGGSVLEGKTGFMPGTTSLKVANFYAKSGREGTIIETLVIQPNDIKAIGHFSESEVIFIARQVSPVL